MPNWERIREILRKEFRQVLREPRMRGLMIGPPIIQLLVFGFVVNLDVEHARLAFFDQDRTPASRELRAAFEGSAYFDLRHAPAGEREAQGLLDRGRVDAVVRVLPGFAADLARGRETQVQVLVDGSNSNTASIVGSYANDVIRTFSSRELMRRIRVKQMNRGGMAANLSSPTIDVRYRTWFNQELRSRNYFVPGVVVNIITLVTLMLTSMAIVREKEIGTMEQLMVTPIRPIELMIGKTLPFAMVGMVNMSMVVVVAMLVFHVPFRGNVLLLAGATLLFLFTTLGAGLFISTISHTQQQALMATFFFFQPVFMLSGFAFPIQNMPEPVQYLTLVNPVRYFMEICRGVFLKGSGVDVLWPQLIALAVFGVAVLLSSALRFHKRLD